VAQHFRFARKAAVPWCIGGLPLFVRSRQQRNTVRKIELHVCWGTFGNAEKHPCKLALDALVDAGHRPNVVKTGGCYGTDPLFPGRRAIKRLTGNYKVPTLILDDGTVIDGSSSIAAWAARHHA
jgi:Glutathione S-transferase, N-terminal domain